MNMPARLLWLGLCLCAVLPDSLPAAEQDVPNVAAVRKVFTAPPRQYATAPLWVWNDMLTDEQIRGTMRDLAAQKVMQVFVHPRPGLMTPYLSGEWFRLWNVALDEAEKLDMNVWIYDENSYPSGFAGGHVPEAMPESRGRGLRLATQQQAPQLEPDTIAVYRVTDGKVENVTAQIRGGQSVPSGPFVVASVVRASNSPWHGDRCYVDLMYPGVTEKFLDITHEAYKQYIGTQFGKRVLGAFADEPNVRPAGNLPWTDHLPDAFQKRWGYSLLDHLPSLAQPVGEWKQVRHDYFQVVLEQFIEHWAKPYSNWCAQNGIAFTGHYWDHEWPNCLGVTDNMAMSAWQQMPGVDCLMNQYREDTHAQFGNVRFVREVHSLCNQLGRERFLCEAYGAGGWDLRFEDMKRIADWLGVLGVNLFDEHLSYITLRGARKADHPQSFSYHEPWWDSYHVMAQYVTRLSAAMSQGRVHNHVLVLEPTTTAWMYQAQSPTPDALGQIGKTFFDLVMALEQVQAEYDIGCEDVLARHGNVQQTRDPNAKPKDAGVMFHVGFAAYDTVVLPPWTETLRSETMQLLEKFAAGGGRILCCGPPPPRVDARTSDRGGRLSAAANWHQIDVTQLPDLLKPTVARERFAIQRAAGDQGILFHQRRRLADGELLLLVNTSIEASSSGTIETIAPGAQKWDLFTGATCSYPFVRADHATKLTYELPPCGSLLLLLTDKPGASSAVVQPTVSEVVVSGKMEIEPIAPNVLTLDYVDLGVDGQVQKNLYFYHANQLAWQANGLPRDPWDSAVQYNDELISRTFPPDSGFEVSYRFTIEGDVPQPLQIVLERPDLYTVTCNAQPVSARPGAWWLDKAFGKLDITTAAHTGENVVTLKAQPFTMFHEIASAYVLGDFSLRSAEAGFVIVPPGPLRVERQLAHATDIEGVAWLSAGIGYHRDPQAKEGNDGAPSVTFDLGRPVDLATTEVWNYNEAALPGRGVKSLEVRAAAAAAELDADAARLGTFTLAPAPGGSPGTRTAFAQKLSTPGSNVRFVKFTILANHDGVQFPTTDGSRGNAFVGLSEVRFWSVGGADKPVLIDGVKIHAVSSELVQGGGHDRRASHLVDGSGLGPAAVGWDRQGMPFYAQGVAYRQSFQVDQVSGRYRVSVAQWYGSVAKVSCNGRLCGHLVSRPWEVDVTEAVQAGKNTIEVLVVGTLKNTLGPHHGPATVGSAWPAMFRQGSEPGPPPGNAYHTLGYGLFQPFTLINAR